MLFGGGAVCLWLGLETNDFYLWRLLGWGLPAFAMVAAVVLIRAPSWKVIELPFKYVGDISYSLYLSHILAIALFVRIYAGFAGAEGGSPLGFAAGLFACVLVIGHLSFVCIERPSRRALMRAMARR